VRHLRAHPVHILKEELSVTKVIIHADGASRGNPGPAAIGATVKDDKGNLLAAVSQRIGRTTNNQAEYRAVIAALEKAVSLGAQDVLVMMDSELAVKQINGRYRVKNVALRPLYQQVVRLTGSFRSFNISYVPRAHNAEADALANKALDAQD
jgi:ribonuclease HI